MKAPIVFISDQQERIRALEGSALSGRTVHLWISGDGRGPRWSSALHGDPTDPRTFEPLGDSDPMVVVDMAGERLASRIARAALRALPASQILIIDRQRGRRHGSVRDGITWIDEGELLGDAIESLLRRAAARKRLRGLQQAVHGAKRCAFLVQHDPDPDAIASSLALREALHLDAARAPIISCGTITRPENRRLVRELRITVRHVSERGLASHGPLILVDVQPPYFGDSLGDVAAVIDHHPPTGPYGARHDDVRTSYGAAATMALEYLRASDTSTLGGPLATALLYGIMTDTKSLTRATSEEDLEAFAYLFPRADHAALRRIQHPSYTPLALKRFGRALQTARVERGLAYIHLGKLPREQEHIVAQLAEFCLGMAGAEVAVVSGVFGERLVMSARALDPKAQLGERLRRVFDALGSAGGHPVMAKAVVPLRALRSLSSVRADTVVATRVRKLLMESLAARS